MKKPKDGILEGKSNSDMGMKELAESLHERPKMGDEASEKEDIVWRTKNS